MTGFSWLKRSVGAGLFTCALLTYATAQPIAPLGPAGVGADAFPKPDRPVAPIVSPVWASEDQRQSLDEVRQVFESMQIKPGMSVADIGAGTGFYTVQLSNSVGPAGTVYAQDVMESYLADLSRRVSEQKLGNVKLGLGNGHDPRLPPGSLDAALLVHMYHEIEQPFGLLYNLAAAMKPDGRIGIVDLDRPILEHGTPPDLLRCELESVGYRHIESRTLTGNIGYLAVFAAPTTPVAPNEIHKCTLK